MPLLGDVLAVLDEWCDPRWAEPWDAVGLVCGDRHDPISSISLAVDAVPATVDEALRHGGGLLITHHPLFLTGVHGVPADDPKGGLVHRMIRAGMAHYVAHTNADVANPGVSDALAAVLGLSDLRPIEPSLASEPGSAQGSAPPSGRGHGRIGTLPAPMTLARFVEHAAAVLPGTAWGVRAAGDPDALVHVIAVCGGAGASLAASARRAGADVLLTGDLKHHPSLEEVTERPGGMALVDAGHWATEAPWIAALATRLRAQFGTTVDIAVSAQVTDPWNVYAPPTESSTPAREC